MTLEEFAKELARINHKALATQKVASVPAEHVVDPAMRAETNRVAESYHAVTSMTGGSLTLHKLPYYAVMAEY